MPTMPGLWSAVSGTMEGDEDPLYRIATEIREETGIVRVRFASSCFMNVSHDIWLYSTLCFVHDGDEYVRLNSENVSYKWVSPFEVSSYDTVPCLSQVLFLLLGSVCALSGEHYVYAGAATHGAGYVISGMLTGSRMYAGGLFGVY